MSQAKEVISHGLDPELKKLAEAVLEVCEDLRRADASILQLQQQVSALKSGG
jgi:hypothetical protein